jgi:Uma2 family endonuclease
MVVVEVLSPSSEGDDDGEKLRDFQSLASLQVYVFAAQDARWVKIRAAHRCCADSLVATITGTLRLITAPEKRAPEADRRPVQR